MKCQLVFFIFEITRIFFFIKILTAENFFYIFMGLIKKNLYKLNVFIRKKINSNVKKILIFYCN